MRRISCGSSSSEKRTEFRTMETGGEIEKGHGLVRKTEHALAQWSTRPCKPKAQQTVSGLHQHPGQEGGVWIKHTWRRNMNRAETAQYSFTCV